MQEQAATCIALAEVAAGAYLPQFTKTEFGAFLEYGILVRGVLRLLCGYCGRDKLIAFSCRRPGFSPSCGAWHVVQTAVHLVILEQSVIEKVLTHLGLLAQAMPRVPARG